MLQFTNARTHDLFMRAESANSQTRFEAAEVMREWHAVNANKLRRKTRKTHQSNPAFDINQTSHLRSFGVEWHMFTLVDSRRLRQRAIVEQWFCVQLTVCGVLSFNANANNDFQWHRARNVVANIDTLPVCRVEFGRPTNVCESVGITVRRFLFNLTSKSVDSKLTPVRIARYGLRWIRRRRRRRSLDEHLALN